MTEYVLGIGHLNEEECEQVLNDVNRRKAKLVSAAESMQNEINHLKLIAFQVKNRQKELETKCKICNIEHDPLPLKWPDHVTKIHMEKEHERH